jgi:hypothetical protein
VLTVERYRRTRFWALYEAGELLCVTVYKKGANAVKERIERNAPLAKPSHTRPTSAPLALDAGGASGQPVKQPWRNGRASASE